MATSETQPEPLRDEASGHNGNRTRFYPVDIPSAPFTRYERSRLTERDIMVHNVMAYYMNPTQRPTTGSDKSTGHSLELQGEYKRDLYILKTSLFTFVDFPGLKPGNSQFPSYDGFSSLCICSADQFPLDVVMRYYMETDDCAMRAWIADTGCTPFIPRHSPIEERAQNQRLADYLATGWRYLVADERDAIARYHLQAGIQDKYPLYTGGVFFPSIRRGLDENDLGVHGSARSAYFDMKDLMPSRRYWDSAPVWPEGHGWARHMLIPTYYCRVSLKWYWRYDQYDECVKDFSTDPGRGRNRDGHWSTGRASPPSATADGRYGRQRRRCTSLPPPGSFASAVLPKGSLVRAPGFLTFIFPRMRLSQLDRRSRRRSLSRTRIEEMFDWDVNIPHLREQPPTPKSGSRCQNCLSPEHHHKTCPSPCGHCGVVSRTADKAAHQSVGLGHLMRPHEAPDCPVAPNNRCKCIAFPTYHVAKDCKVTCHRACGNPARPGSAAHRNAMLCKSRCCMCGIRGHSGRECTNKKCRCGGRHLGQDCCWNPTCRVKGCDRYLCGIHCRECGSDERPFRDRKCWRCHGADGPFEWTKERRRKDKKQEKETSEQSAPDGGDEIEGTEDKNKAVPPVSKEDEVVVTTAPTNSIFGNPGWSFSEAVTRPNV